MNTIRTVTACLVVMALAGSGRADIIYSKNGRSIEGVVREETPEHVVLAIGSGTMTFRRSQIQRIERASEDRNTGLRDGWRRRYYLNDPYVPDGEKPLAIAFKKLKSARSSAVKARRGQAALAQAENKLLDKIEGLERDRLSANRKLATAKPRDNVAAYNTLVARVNALQADIAVCRAELQKLDDRRKGTLETFSRYLEQTTAFRNTYGERLRLHEHRPPDDERSFFFAEIGGELASFEKEFRGTGVPVKRRGNSSIVSAVINGKRTGSFIVDTGATLMTVTEPFAVALGIKSSQLPKVTVVMADGRKVDARSVSLRSVRVGDALVGDVRAVVLPETPAEGIDGLLGMAFLRHFSVNLDGATGKLQLRHFAPGE